MTKNTFFFKIKNYSIFINLITNRKLNFELILLRIKLILKITIIELTKIKFK